jgi:excisionase family DNA binding protein
MAAEALLTTEEVAALLRVHPKQVYRLLRRGLPGRRVGAEWRFERAEVLAWAGGRGVAAPAEAPGPAAAPQMEQPPPLVAANGDLAVDILLRLARERDLLLGLVLADLGAGAALLARGAVLAAGAHAGAFPSHVGTDRVARIHLVAREVGLVAPRGAPVPPLDALPLLTLASRPSSAGVRIHLDRALAAAGVGRRRRGGPPARAPPRLAPRGRRRGRGGARRRRARLGRVGRAARPPVPPDCARGVRPPRPRARPRRSAGRPALRGGAVGGVPARGRRDRRVRRGRRRRHPLRRRVTLVRRSPERPEDGGTPARPGPQM